MRSTCADGRQHPTRLTYRSIGGGRSEGSSSTFALKTARANFCPFMSRASLRKTPGPPARTNASRFNRRTHARMRCVSVRWPATHIRCTICVCVCSSVCSSSRWVIRGVRPPLYYIVYDYRTAHFQHSGAFISHASVCRGLRASAGRAELARIIAGTDAVVRRHDDRRQKSASCAHAHALAYLRFGMCARTDMARPLRPENRSIRTANWLAQQLGKLGSAHTGCDAIGHASAPECR